MYGFESNTTLNRYSAKRMIKPVSFICQAPRAQTVFLAGDFDDRNSQSHPIQRQPDGAWLTQVSLHHGHHRYLFFVDDTPRA